MKATGSAGKPVDKLTEAQAKAEDALVSHAVQGILAGSRYSFEDRGMHELKGVPGKWMIYAVNVDRAT